jgi:hypothetical protein
MEFSAAFDNGEQFADRYAVIFSSGDVYNMSSDADQANGCCIFSCTLEGIKREHLAREYKRTHSSDRKPKRLHLEKLPSGTQRQIAELIKRQQIEDDAQAELDRRDAAGRFSPAPWRFDGHGINDSRGRRIFKVQYQAGPYDPQPDGSPGRSRRYDADSLLVAAVPEMYLALQQLVEICQVKCSPSDEIILANGKTNDRALREALFVLGKADANQ